MLAEILLGHDGSPLTKTLLESGLGEDITPVSGFESEIGETIFVAGLRGVGGGKVKDVSEKQVESLIMNELRRLASEGIPKEEIEAALLNIEFSLREVKRAGGPFSLVWMRRSLRAWLHGRKPWESLLLSPALDGIKKRLAEDSRFFESLIQKYLLDNPHRALITIDPQEDFLPKQETELAEKLAKIERGFSVEEKEFVMEKSAALEKIQSEGDSPEALASIPHLSRNDLSPEPEIIPRRMEDLRGIPALCHDLYTNGISYIDLAFPLDILPPEDYPWLPFFSRAIISVGLPGMDYAEVSSLLARTVGGFTAILHTGSAFPADKGSAIATASGEFDLAGRDLLVYRLKCLDEKTNSSLDLARRLISEADFSDTRRVKDLVLEMKNELRSSLAPMGHIYASYRAGRFSSVSSRTSEIWNGLEQIMFAHRLAEMEIEEVIGKLKYLRTAIASGGLIASMAGSAEALKSSGELIARQFGEFGPPQRCRDTPKAVSGIAGNEIFASPSLQVGFAAMSMRAAAFDTLEQVAETALAHQLSTGPLWEDIRMKGGAYGAFASGDHLERHFSFSTYRDPNPLRSMESFAAVLRPGDNAFMGEDDLVKTIIGCYARETRPRAPSEKNISDFFRFISRIDDGCRRRKLQRLIAVSAGDVSAALGGLVSQVEQEPAKSAIGRVIITGMKGAEQATKALGTEARALPV
jgi:Zn-dependent M16 (insulinase) family peptidase